MALAYIIAVQSLLLDVVDLYEDPSTVVEFIAIVVNTPFHTHNGIKVEPVRVLRTCCHHTCPAMPGCLEAPSHRPHCVETQNSG